mmetsp:Transcript_58848/g.140343  ORF Transcript_58848/g.140343 Transcript_58848/m.140343 type:complete len:225 (+) Transcript_58848:3722-4396(+)
MALWLSRLDNCACCFHSSWTRLGVKLRDEPVQAAEHKRCGGSTGQHLCNGSVLGRCSILATGSEACINLRCNCLSRLLCRQSSLLNFLICSLALLVILLGSESITLSLSLGLSLSLLDSCQSLHVGLILLELLQVVLKLLLGGSVWLVLDAFLKIVNLHLLSCYELLHVLNRTKLRARGCRCGCRCCCRLSCCCLWSSLGLGFSRRLRCNFWRHLFEAGGVGVF